MQNRLKVRRAELGVTQIKVAATSGVGATKLSYIENELAEPTEDEIAALARALDTTPDALFPGLAPQPASQETR